MAPRKYPKNKHKKIPRNLLKTSCPDKNTTQVPRVQNMTILETSDVEQLEIKIQPMPLKHLATEVAMRSSERIANPMLLKETEKASEGGARFEPLACSTPISTISGDPNISEISSINLEEEIPETQELFFQKTTEDNQTAMFFGGKQYSFDPPAFVHQQEEILKNTKFERTNQRIALGESSHSDSYFEDDYEIPVLEKCFIEDKNIGKERFLELIRTLEELFASRTNSTGDLDKEHSDNSVKLSQETPATSHSKEETKKDPKNSVSKWLEKTVEKKGIQKDIAKGNSKNVMQESSPLISIEEKHHSRLASRIEIVKTNNFEESTYNECTVETDEFDDHATELVEISKTSVVETNNNTKARFYDIFKNSKSMMRKIDGTKDSDAKQSQENKKIKYSHGSRSKPMKSSHPFSEELNERLRHSSRTRKLPIVYWSCRLQNYNLSKKERKETFSINNNKKRQGLLVKKHKIKIGRSMKVSKTYENKEHSGNLKSKMTQNNVMSKNAADRVAVNESKTADKFDRLKGSLSTKKLKKRNYPRTNGKNVMKKSIKFSENSSYRFPESNDSDKVVAAPFSSDDGIFTSEENHHPKPSMASLHKSTMDSGNQTGTINVTNVNQENRSVLWLKNLTMPRTCAHNKDVVHILSSDTIKRDTGSVEDLKIEEINGVEFVYYLGEDNNYGCMKFHPHSVKPNARTQEFELQYLSLVGTLQMKIDENLFTMKAGDLITVPKGVRYKISNPSNDSAVLFFILSPAT